MKIIVTAFIFLLSAISSVAQQNPVSSKASVYHVSRLKNPMEIDANWNKAAWKKIKALNVRNFIREDPKFRPKVEAKMAYDQDNIYVIFRVEDRYVRAVTRDINGPVWKDSAVEFFFAPDTAAPKNYFNLEVNCIGTPLLGYRPKKPEVEDIRKIQIAHSLPEVVDPEIASPVVWTLEYRIPLDMLAKYTSLARPAKGVSWRGNFYKIAEINSNPHHATWSVIDHPKPTFHLPQYFGTLKFKD